MVSDDVILEQVEYTYDAAGNVILIVTRQRYHNAPDSQTGPLNDPGLAPKARVTYLALYPDALGRIVATADYGTNGGAAFTRSATIPARSDTVLVNSVEFDSAGNVLRTTDPKGIVTRFEYDDLGREVTVIEDDGGTDRTTRATYTPDGLQATLVAENADTGNQTTTYTYGTTLSDSDLATSTLMRTVAYPDSTGGSDTLTYSYNRRGELVTATDQRGCVHTYDRDKLARLIHDRVTTLGSGVDGAVRRLSASYDVRGRAYKLTSWNNASVNSGDVVNECFFVFNSFRQLITDYQSHSGAVNTSTSPKVQLAYADGSANTVRPTSLVYPDGRTLTYGYGATDGIDDACSRVASLIDDDGPNTHLADYSFLGLGVTVVVDFTEPDVKYTLVDLSGTNDPDTGDIYSGLDRFGRVKDCRWYDYGGSADTARLKYGYDRASNRLWREDTVATSLSKNFDELYAYDTLHRLADLQRGRLNGGHTSIGSKTFAQAWTLDATGNWQGFEEAATGGSLTLDQSRDSNTVNEITGITNSVGSAWVTPAHDPAGNMTTIPQPADPTVSFTATFDAWNRLVKLVDDDTSDTVQENEYDARTFRTVRKDYTGGTLSEERHCYYTPGWRCLEERLGSSPDSTDPDRQFVWGNRYIDDLVLRDRDSDTNGSLNERLYATQDANWNIVALTDTSGTVQERYAYAAYGLTKVLDSGFVVRTSSSYGWETTYCGYRWEVGSALLAVRNRYLHPVLGVWLTRDPIGYVGGINLFEYCVASPLSHLDPFGLEDLHHVFMSTQIGNIANTCGSLLSWLGISAEFFRDLFTVPLPTGMQVGGAHYYFHHGEGGNFYRNALREIGNTHAGNCCDYLKAVRKLLEEIYQQWYENQYPPGFVGPTMQNPSPLYVLYKHPEINNTSLFDIMIDRACNSPQNRRNNNVREELRLSRERGGEVVRINRYEDPIGEFTSGLECLARENDRQVEQRRSAQRIIAQMVLVAGAGASIHLVGSAAAGAGFVQTVTTTGGTLIPSTFLNSSMGAGAAKATTMSAGIVTSVIIRNAD